MQKTTTIVLKIKLFGLRELHGFHYKPYTILKHGQYFFYNFSLFFNVFIRIDEYAILIILISVHWVTALCLSIKLVPRLVI